MSVDSLHLTSDKLERVSHPSRPFWLPLLAMLFLSLSFLDFSNDVEINKLGNASDTGEIKFLMHIVAFTIMGFIFIRHDKGSIPASPDLKLYVAYCTLIMVSIFVHAFRVGDTNAVMFARGFDLTLFAFVILVFLRMEIQDTFFITFVAISTPVYIVLSLYFVFPEEAFHRFVSPTTGDLIYRFGGKYIHPNTLGGIAAISLIMLFGIKIRSLFKVLLSLLFFLVLILSQSRMAVLVLVVSLIASYLLAKGNSVNKLIGGCVLTLVLIAAVVAYQAGLGDLIPSRDMFDNIDTLSGRTLLWKIALTEFFNGSAMDFLFGMEPFFTTKKFIVSKGWETSSLHNSYLHVFLGCGIFVGILYPLMLIRLLRVKASKKGLSLSLRAIAIFILVVGLTEQSAAVKLDPFTTLLPLIMAQCYRTKSTGDTKPETP